MPELVSIGSVHNDGSDTVTILEDAHTRTLSEAGNDAIFGLVEANTGAAIALLDVTVLSTLKVKFSALASRNPEDDDGLAILD